jgi:uncharacterized Fe-S radical SAM superfamily protein PflX
MGWIEHSNPSVMGMMLMKEYQPVFASSEYDLKRLLREKEIDNLDYIEGLVLLREKRKCLERVNNRLSR